MMGDTCHDKNLICFLAFILVEGFYMDKFNINSQIEHLQAKYVGTGHADTNKFEWLVNQHRDTYASLIGHARMNSYIALVENNSIARVKHQLKQKMLQPCGVPPAPKEF